MPTAQNIDFPNKHHQQSPYLTSLWVYCWFVHQAMLLYNSMLQPQQKSKENQPNDPEPRLLLLGSCSLKMTDSLHQPDKSHFLQEIMLKAFARTKKSYPFVPLKINTLPNCIAIIDNRSKLWAILDLINEPVCLSDMLKLKVSEVALGHSQMVVATSEGQLLVTWAGKRSFNEKHLTRLAFKNVKFKYAHFFELYEIEKDCSRHDRFFFTNGQKISNQTLVYRITDNSKAIMRYPQLNRIVLPRQIMGISLGKYHNLLWDSQGKLYSWGCKSIALGYSSLPSQEIIEEPQQVQLLRGHVTKAFAGTNYSLAITLDGKLYEWGINRNNPKKDEIFFEPKEIKTSNLSKFVDLKGKGDNFGVLSLVGELYLWGRTAKTLLGGSARLNSDLSITEPTSYGLKNGYVLDFEIDETCVVLVTGSSNAQTCENRKLYWSNLMGSIQRNLKGKSENPRHSSNEAYHKPRLEELSLTATTFRKVHDPIEIAFERRKAKESYLSSAVEPDKAINYLMQPSQRNVYNSLSTGQFSIFEAKDKRQSYKGATSKRLHTAMDDFSNDFKKEKEYIQKLVQKVQGMKSQPRLLRFNRNQEVVIRPIRTLQTNQSYEARLESVRRRKEINQIVFIEQTMRKVENRSFEFRIAKRLEHQQEKKRAKEAQQYKQGLQKFIVKQFLVKLLTKPIAQGRQVKIASFARYLKLQRIEKKIRGLFIRTRVKLNMRKLHHNQVFRFFLLTMTFQQYVKRFRLRKQKQMRKTIVGEIFKGVMRQKLKVGITACNFSVRKLQKFRDWLSLVKSQRKKCLKYIWKVHLLSIMRINPDSESSAIFYLPKNFDQLTFEALYQEKVIANPLLKLSNFLNHHTIFRIKATIFQQLFALSRVEGNKEKSNKAAKAIGKSRRFRIKFSQDQDDKQDRFNLIQTDIFPFSVHYNIVMHPKNYDITIPEIMKVSEKWIREEKRILDRHIDLIIKTHEIQYLSRRRRYDVDLAHYIKKNYDLFSEKRWKYIIQFNKLQKKEEKSKKEKEIRRVMKLIGAESILDEDCIPEKQAILDEVFKRGDAPQLPNSHITFGANEFKKLFRAYYEAVAGKAKEMRRNFL